MRAELDRDYSNRLFLAEANQWPKDMREYFGNGDECHMAYHFPLMLRMCMAIAQEDRHPIVEIMEQTPDIPENYQWTVFLRNHDELTLERVTNRKRGLISGLTHRRSTATVTACVPRCNGTVHYTAASRSQPKINYSCRRLWMHHMAMAP